MRNLEEHSGYWWTPDNPERQFPGRLVVENDEAHLCLTIDSQSPSVSLNHTRDYDVIHGRTSNGKLISLLSCFDLSTSWSSAGLESRKILANFVLVGGLVPKCSPGQGQFKAMSLSWPSLRTWFGHSGVSVEWNKQNLQEFSVEYKQREPIEIICPDGLKIGFAFSTDCLPVGGVLSDQIRFREIVWITTTPTSPQNLEYFLALLHELEHFFSVCVLDYCTPDEVSLLGAFDFDAGADGLNVPPHMEVHLSPALQSKSSRSPHPMDILLPYQTVGENLQTIIGRWHAMAPDLHPVRSLYFSSLYGPNRYVDSTFLSLAQAVEVFHRRMKGGIYLEEKVFKEKVAERLIGFLPEDLDDTIRKVFSQRLRFMNEYSLAKRITELVEAHSGVVETYIADWKPVVRSIVAARNYYTHYSEDQKDKRPSAQNLADYQDFIRMLLEMAFLSAIGVDAEVLHRRALGCQKYRPMFSGRAST